MSNIYYISVSIYFHEPVPGFLIVKQQQEPVDDTVTVSACLFEQSRLVRRRDHSKNFVATSNPPW